MKISVVIPAYNEENYIGQCLHSLSHQKEKPDEIIVVDNNCRDETVAIAKKFGARLVEEKRQGMIFARNRGFDSAQGEIIARCDADVILPEDWIKRIKYDFETNVIDALTGPVNYYDLPIRQPYLAALYLYLAKTFNHGKNILVGPNMVITKNIWLKVKDQVCLNDHQVHEDIDLAIHIRKLGGTVMMDKLLIVHNSGRRIKNNPYSFFGEYPIRFIKTFLAHKN